MGNFTFVNKAPNIIEKKHQTLTNFSFFYRKKPTHHKKQQIFITNGQLQTQSPNQHLFAQV